MALITCHECKKEFSTDAKKCPQCGARRKKTKSEERIEIIGAIVGIGVMIWVAVDSKPYDICKDKYDAYAVVKTLVEQNPNEKMASINETKFEYLDGCRIRVSGYAMMTRPSGYKERDDMRLIVKKQTDEKGADWLVVDLAESMK